MLKGHVFKEQIFGNQIFALFINTFLNGRNGISNNYKNGMAITKNENTLTVQGGAAVIQGRFVEEDTFTEIPVDAEDAYCALVIEVNLDKQNTSLEFKQATYKILKSSSTYPSLTQNNIVKNNSGIYQYELARFKTSSNGISDLEDKRTFLDLPSIFDTMETEYEGVLAELEEKLDSVIDGSAYWLKGQELTNQDLNDYKEEGFFYAKGGNAVVNKPRRYYTFKCRLVWNASNKNWRKPLYTNFIFSSR